MAVTIVSCHDETRANEAILCSNKGRVDHSRLRLLADGMRELIEPQRPLAQACDNEHVPAMSEQGIDISKRLEVHVVTPRVRHVVTPGEVSKARWEIGGGFSVCNVNLNRA